MHAAAGRQSESSAASPGPAPGQGRARGVITPIAVLLAAAAGWMVLREDGKSMGTAVLGWYRERWFLVNCALTYLALCLTFGRALGIGRRTARRLLTHHLLGLLAIGALELLAVLGWVDYRERLQYAGTVSFGGSRAATLRRWTRPDVRLEGMGQQDLTRILGVPARAIPYSFQTDRHGLRNKGPKDQARVLCLGDSFLVAGLVPIDEILTERLEVLIGQQVLNVSEVQYAPQEAFERARTTGLSFAGRTVLQFVFEGNDLADSANWHEWRGRRLASGWPHSGLIKTLLALLHRPTPGFVARRRGEFVDAGGKPQPVWFYYDAPMINAQMGEMDRMTAGLAEAASEVRRAGGRYGVVFIPAKITVLHPFCRWPSDSDLRDPALHQAALGPALAAFCSREGLPFFDATPPLQDACRGGLLPFFEADTHLAPAGHDVLARALAPWITALSK